MIFLLDINTCVQYLNGRVPNIRIRLQSETPNNIVVCSIVKAELFFGAMKSQNPQRTLKEQHAFLNQFWSLPFDDNAAEHYGEIRAHLAKQGNPIGPNDLMIAAIALAFGVTLVTHNTREFSRVPGLLLEDWEI